METEQKADPFEERPEENDHGNWIWLEREGVLAPHQACGVWTGQGWSFVRIPLDFGTAGLPCGVTAVPTALKLWPGRTTDAALPSSAWEKSGVLNSARAKARQRSDI